MSSITISSNVIGSNFIVALCDLDQDKSTLSFALTKNNHQICFLNVVNPSLRHRNCESYNVFVNLPKGADKKVNVKVNSHSNTNWNEKVNKSLHRSDLIIMIQVLLILIKTLKKLTKLKTQY